MPKRQSSPKGAIGPRLAFDVVGYLLASWPLPVRRSLFRPTPGLCGSAGAAVCGFNGVLTWSSKAVHFCDGLVRRTMLGWTAVDPKCHTHTLNG
eukprot:2272609-Amphidinium_carterae.1